MDIGETKVAVAAGRKSVDLPEFAMSLECSKMVSRLPWLARLAWLAGLAVLAPVAGSLEVPNSEQKDKTRVSL